MSAPAFDYAYSQLLPTGVSAARSDSAATGTIVDGSGVKVGILDTGARPDVAGLSGQIAWYGNYAGADTSTQDADGHGTMVAEMLAGLPVDGSSFKGGVATGARLYVARTMSDSGAGSYTYLPQALNDLTGQGVRLFNISSGSSYSITSAADPQNNLTAAVSWMVANLQTVIDHDGLMVWSAGNDGHDQVSVEAGLPYLAPQFAHNWLAVVNVALDGQGNVIGLEGASHGEPSNACGAAASWCLAAPGSVWGVPVPGTEFGSGAGVGTSFSAPIVTGIAAMVWQKYPWMSAANVQETLLGTATPIGDPSLYGYGLVDAEAAIRGPQRLDWDFDADIPGGAYSFDNDISGAGRLTLDGAGALTLNGSDDIGGGVTVNGGALAVGRFLQADVAVNANAVLAGAAGAVVKGIVTNDGTVSTAGGAWTIEGQYRAGAGSTTAIYLGNPLQVDGTATLGGGKVAISYGSGYVAKSSEPLVVTTGGLTGTFGSFVDTGNVYTAGELSYTAKEADVVLSRMSVQGVALAAAPASAANVQQAAAHVEQALQQADAWATSGAAGHGAFLSDAAALEQAPTLKVAAASLDSLSGQIHASSEALTLAQAGIANRALADRLVDGGRDTGAWAEGTGASGDVGRTGFATGKYGGGGAMAGVDGEVGDGLVVGGALGWNKLDADYRGDAGTSSSRSSGLSLYARYDAGDAYVLGRVGQDWIRSRVNRYAVLGTRRQTLGTERDDRLASAYMEGGYRFGSDRGALTPFVSLGRNRLARDGFTEQGSTFGLTAKAQSFDQSTGQLGARWTVAWDWSGGRSSLAAYLLWQQVLSGQDTGFTAAYVGAPGATFRVAGAVEPRRSGWAGLGLTTRAGARWRWYVSLDVQQGGGPTRSRALTAGIEWTL